MCNDIVLRLNNNHVSDTPITVQDVIGLFWARKIKRMLTVGILNEEWSVKVFVDAVSTHAKILGNIKEQICDMSDDFNLTCSILLVELTVSP